MNLPFKSGFEITQLFGVDPQYYSQSGLKGHEGLDLIPTDNDRDLYAVESGIVVRDYDRPRDNYGNTVVIWNEKNNRGWWYCHLHRNVLSVGQEVEMKFIGDDGE